MAKDNSPEEIERILRFNKAFKDRTPYANNLPTVEKVSKSEFKEGLAAQDYAGYAHAAHHHYAVARLLFILHFWNYALFCSQQAIENYLKAYLKLSNKQPPLSHPLKDLLRLCREVDQPQDFIRSDYVEIIVERFDPFNEVARYPVAHTRPAGGTWTSIYPTDMYILDYFIYKMRAIVELPGNHSDLFKSGGISPHFVMFPDSSPDMFRRLKQDNINFE